MTELSRALAARIATARAIVFDMDGTLVLGDSSSAGHRALAGAVELLARLRDRGIPFRIFTNGTAKVPSVYAGSLRHAGLDVRDQEVITPSSVAAEWFQRRRIRRIRVLGQEGAQAPLRDAGLQVFGPAARARGVEAVFTGWFREFSFSDLEAACSDVWAGAILTTASNVRFFATQGGRSLGASFAMNAVLRAATGRRARVLGKPSTEALGCVLRTMDLPASAATHTLVIGDDPALEMRMARSAGAVAVAVTTGITDRESLAAARPAEAPDLVLDGLTPLLAVFSGGEGGRYPIPRLSHSYLAMHDSRSRKGGRSRR